jgi:hypothetical protein
MPKTAGKSSERRKRSAATPYSNADFAESG